VHNQGNDGIKIAPNPLTCLPTKSEADKKIVSNSQSLYLMAPMACMKVRMFIMEVGEAFSWLRDMSRC
jgi:hypothetical protein